MKFARNEHAWFRYKSSGNGYNRLFHGKLEKYNKKKPGFRLYSNSGSMNMCHWFRELFDHAWEKNRKKLGDITKLSNISFYADMRLSKSHMTAYDVVWYLREYYKKIEEDTNKKYIENPIYLVQEQQVVYDIEDTTKYVNAYVTIEAFLTYNGAQEFIEHKQQHYNSLRIYTKSSIGNSEWILIRRIFQNYPEFKLRFDI